MVITQDKKLKTLKLTQTDYIRKVLRQFEMEGAKAIFTHKAIST